MRYLYRQNTPKRLVKVWLTAGSILVFACWLFVGILFGDKPLSFTVEFSNRTAMDGFMALGVLALLAYGSLRYLVGLRRGVWITGVQFFLPVVLVDDEDRIVQQPLTPISFSELATRQKGAFDIDWCSYNEPDGDGVMKRTGLQFWLGRRRLICSLESTFDVMPGEFLRVFVTQIKTIRPDLTLSPDVAKRV
ncbi:hypothetical protein R69776_04339 [Paraburkholderia nemoris]|uniref:Uncharacterized protein n=2 Tax=Paraburkholderia nemoris TaxID=2793076 RepID=A0ABM8S0A6_9BURK|nr:hypothetical protein R75777_03644 [Paraburkholderia nemoris]CAE6781594.1 hypothetical protein R69776_04339 [Paraburkholderia nemoris]